MSSPRASQLGPVDIVIRADYLLCWEKEELQIMRHQDVAVKDAKIVHRGPAEGHLQDWRAARHIEASGRLLMPGLVNSHCHLPMSFFRGLADDLSFHDWLFKNILPLEGRVVNPEFVRLGTQLSLVESIQWGVTTLYDMFYFEADIADEMDRAGIRGLAGQSDLDHPVPDNPKKDGASYRIMDEVREKYSGHPRITPMIAPHAPYTCSDDTLARAVKYAEKYNLPLGIHVAETRQECEESQKLYGLSPVQRMKNLGVASERSIFAHCVHLDDRDIETLRETQTSVAYNPESNMKLGVGAARIPDLLRAGVTVGIGTDGPASNNDLNIFREMDVGAKLQKLSGSSPSAITARQMLKMATLDGARAMKLSHVGNIETGYWADMIVLDLERPHLKPVHDLASSLVYSANGSEVKTVICHGKILLDEGRHLTLQPSEVYARVDDFRRRFAF